MFTTSPSGPAGLPVPPDSVRAIHPASHEKTERANLWRSSPRFSCNEGPAPFGLVIDICEAVNGLVDAPDFGDRLGQLRWAVIHAKRSHDRGCLDHAQLQGSGQAKHVIPVVLDEVCIDAMPGNTIETTIVRRRTRNYRNSSMVCAAATGNHGKNDGE